MAARRTTKTTGKGSEHHEQTRFVQQARNFYPDVIIAAVPNGAKTGRREGAKLKKEGLLPGYPDLLIDEARGGYFGLRIEMKCPKPRGTVSKAQRARIKQLEAKGYHVVVCYGAEAALDALEAYMAAHPTVVKWDVLA